MCSSDLNLMALHSTGVAGIGQECEIYLLTPKGTRGPIGERPEPSGHDELPCTEVDEAGKPTGREAINPYSGQPYPPSKRPYYVYEVVTRCDSGD